MKPTPIAIITMLTLITCGVGYLALDSYRENDRRETEAAVDRVMAYEICINRLDVAFPNMTNEQRKARIDSSCGS